MNKRVPGFTILMTTYKRPELLKIALASVLQQTYRNFEIVLIDDASRDDTRKVVTQFADPRIVYIENKKNCGFPENFKKGIQKAIGTYIFLLSDDDLILKPTTLAVAYKKMQETKSWYGQTGLFFYEDSFDNLPSLLPSPGIMKTVVIKPSPKILFQTRHWHFGFASGNIYRRDAINLDDIENDVWFAHVKPIYRLMLARGAVYFGDYPVVGRISKSGNVSYLDISVNKQFHMQKLLSLYQEYDSSSTRFSAYKKMHITDGAIKNFPGIKLYTSNQNVVKTVQSIISFAPEYRFNLQLWFYAIMALITPKFILSTVRSVLLARGTDHIKPLLRSIQYQRYLDTLLQFTHRYAARRIKTA